MHLTEELLQRYLRHACTPEEEAFVLNALHDNASPQDLLEKYWEDAAGAQELPHADRQAMLIHIKDRITVTAPVAPVRKLWPLNQTVRIAASVTLALGVALFLILRERQLQYHTIASGNDLRQIVLPDSTVIWLASHSKLTYSNAYNKEERHVRLSGEAYFDVKHDATRPFKVTASALTTRVLGTRFNVKADSAEHEIAITLLQGRISVSKEDSLHGTSKTLATLTPNQQLLYNDSTRMSTLVAVDASDYVSWRDGILNLKNITLHEAAKRIEKWYGVSIAISDPALRKCTVHASFQQQPLENVLRTLGMTAGFSYTIASRHVTITGRGCNTAMH